MMKTPLEILLGSKGGHGPSPRDIMACLGMFPLAGSKKGDRAEIERVYVGTYNLAQGVPTVISRDILVGDPWLALRLNLKGSLTGAAGVAGTPVADSPLPLWSLALTTDLDRDVIEASVEARALYRYAQLLNSVPGAITAAVLPGVGLTTSFNVVLTVPFVDPKLKVPMDTVLDTRRYQTMTLTINSGTLANLVSGAANLTLNQLSVDIEIVRVSPRVPLPLNVAKVLPFFKRFAPLTPPADTSVNLDKIPTLAYKRIAFFCSTGATAGAPFTGAGDNTILSGLRVFSNLRDHFGSASGSVPQALIQAGNGEDYEIPSWPAGWNVVDFVLDRSIWSSLASGDKSVLQAILAYQASLPATPQVSVFAAGLQKLRGKEGV